MRVLAFTAAAATAAVAAQRGTVVHPYLLADNRHYTFYLWKDVLSKVQGRPWVLAPAYAAATYALPSKLSSAFVGTSLRSHTRMNLPSCSRCINLLSR
jgi:DIE2/ALG10 family